MTEILKDIGRNFQKLVKHNIPLTFPPSKRQCFVRKIFHVWLHFFCHFFLLFPCQANVRGENNLECEAQLCSAPPVLQMSDVRKITSCAPYLSFLTVMWELHFLLSQKWWEVKSVRDCEMLKHSDVEMNVRQICEQKTTRILFREFYSDPYLPNQYHICGPKGGHASLDVWTGLWTDV